MKVRLYSFKSFRHYGGREIKSTALLCEAVLIEEQIDRTFYVELLESAAGYNKGHKIAVNPIDYNIIQTA